MLARCFLRISVPFPFTTIITAAAEGAPNKLSCKPTWPKVIKSPLQRQRNKLNLYNIIFKYEKPQFSIPRPIGVIKTFPSMISLTLTAQKNI